MKLAAVILTAGMGLTPEPQAPLSVITFDEGQTIEATCVDSGGCIVVTKRTLDALLAKAAQAGRASCGRTI